MKLLYSLSLALLLVAAPLTVAWSDEPGTATPKANKTDTAKSKEAARVAQVKKDKEHVRQVVLAKKEQRLAKKNGTHVSKRPTDKTMDLKAKAGSKPNAKSVAKTGSKKSHNAARKPGSAPGPLGIRTWTFPESNEARTKKLNELAGHIRVAENAYDAENAKYQKLLKSSKDQAKPDPKTATTPDMQRAASQQRLTEIMQKLDALHQHRNEVAGIVFLKNVKN
ncbi:MAG: hypothetical protein HQL86_00240 [Magnetococcales bacterium]|nr:hypothetical protein [Magnetococcales bacterium]